MIKLIEQSSLIQMVIGAILAFLGYWGVKYYNVKKQRDQLAQDKVIDETEDKLDEIKKSVQDKPISDVIREHNEDIRSRE